MTRKAGAAWAHQNEALEYLVSDDIRAARWARVNVPTGSGKTMILCAQVILGLRSNQFRAALVVTSQRSIEEQFLTGKPLKFQVNGEEITVRTGHKTWVRPRETDDTLAAFQDYMAKPKGRAMVTTHAQLTVWGLTALPDDLTGCALIVDEGHHKGRESTQLYDLAVAWWRRGGHVTSASACAFREDGQPQKPMEVHAPAFSVGYAELAEAGILPRDGFRYQTIELVAASRPNQLLDADYSQIANWVWCCKRPTLLRIAPGNDGRPAKETAARFYTELLAQGFEPHQVHIAVGEDAAEPTDQMLSAERAAIERGGYPASKIKVVIACGRMGEGADWPVCSAVVQVGIPTSPVKFAQNGGRGSRGKYGIKGYPKEWADDVLYVMFVPRLADDEQDQQAVRLVLASVVLTMSEVAAKYTRYWRQHVRGMRLPPVVRDRLIAGWDPGDPGEAAGVPAGVVALLRERLGRDPTLGECLRYLRTLQNGRTLVHGVIQLIDSVGGPAADAIRQAIEAAVEAAAKGIEPGTTTSGTTTSGTTTAVGPRRDVRPEAMAHDLLHDALLSLAEQYRDVPVALDLQIGRAFGVALTPKLMRQAKLSAELRVHEILMGVSPRRLLDEIIPAYIAAHGHPPTVGAGEQVVNHLLDFPCTLDEIDAHLREQHNTTLAWLVTLHTFGWHTGPGLPPPEAAPWPRAKGVTRIRLRAAVNGPPSGAYEASLDRMLRTTMAGRTENFLGLELCYRLGLRGRPGNESLLT